MSMDVEQAAHNAALVFHANQWKWQGLLPPGARMIQAHIEDLLKHLDYEGVRKAESGRIVVENLFDPEGLEHGGHRKVGRRILLELAYEWDGEDEP